MNQSDNRLRIALYLLRDQDTLLTVKIGRNL